MPFCVIVILIELSLNMYYTAIINAFIKKILQYCVDV